MKENQIKSVRSSPGPPQDEFRFERIVENLAVPLAILVPVCDSSNNIIDFLFKYANKALTSLLQMKAEDLTGAKMLKQFPKLRNSELFMKLCEAAVNHTPRVLHSVRNDFYGKAPDKPVKFYDISISADEHELIVTMHDVTYRGLKDAESQSDNKQQKQKPEQSGLNEKLIHLIAETSFVLVSASRADGLYIYTNKALRDFFGVSEEEILTINPFNYVHKEDVARLRDYLSKDNPKEDKTESIELRLSNKAGLYRWLEVFAYYIVLEGNTYIIGLATVIDEKKKAEQELSRSEVKFRELAESITDVFFAMDRDLRVTYWNKASEKLSGIRSKNVIKRSLFDNFPDTKGSKIEEFFRNVLSKQTPDSIVYEYRLQEKDYVFEVSAYPVHNGISVFVKDISKRRHDEETLKKFTEELKDYRDHLEELVKERTIELKAEKERAESADHMKSAFLAAMSHELRTPLNSIIGFTGILLQRRPGELNDEQEKQLGMVQNSARHLLALINQILDLSKIEAGQLNISCERFDFPEIIHKVIETNEGFAYKKNLGLSLSIAPGVKEIVSDKLRVQQILLNLVNNAIKFTEEGSVSIESFIKDNSIIIKVSDTGIGIEKSRLKDIFRPFIQLDSGGARKHEGTGLGLTISQRLTGLLSGTLTVESQYGKGSTFTLTLPLEREV